MKIFSYLVVVLVLFHAENVHSALIHHYTFDSDTSDSAGTANGVLVNGATVSGGRLVLDGVNDYVQFGSFIVPTSGDYSVSFFAESSSVQTLYTEMISQGFSGGGFYIGQTAVAVSASRVIRVSDFWINTTVPHPVDLMQHHFAVTVGASSTSLYIDGSFAASFASPVYSHPTLGTNTRLGTQFSTFNEFFHGTLDDVRIYDNTLTADEVLNIASIPEPGSLGLLGAGLLGFAFARGRKAA
ncbi:MAG: LamG domain-containing protein [Gammaproteobacteria bacterium]|nr:LamG domain-containing protein [Gammaproteobacteria bacterium]